MYLILLSLESMWLLSSGLGVVGVDSGDHFLLQPGDYEGHSRQRDWL